MRVDWVVTKSDDGHLVFIGAGSGDLSKRDSQPHFERCVAGPKKWPPRWAVMDRPEAFRSKQGDLEALLKFMFGTIGPVGLVLGDQIGAESRTVAHPRVGRLRVKDAQFGFERGEPNAPIREIEKLIKWRVEEKANWWVFSRGQDAKVKSPWEATAVALAVICGYDTSLSELEGWRQSLEYRLLQLRGKHAAVQVSRALLSTIEPLLDQGALLLAEERLGAFIAAGGQPAVWAPYKILIDWMKQDWAALTSTANTHTTSKSPALAWRVAWAQIETGKSEAAAATLAQYPDLPPVGTRVGAWFRATLALAEASRGNLRNAIRLLGEVPSDPLLAPTRARIGSLVAEAVNRVADKDRVPVALGEVTHWEADDLPAEVRDAVRPWLRARAPAPEPSLPAGSQESYEGWEEGRRRAGADQAEVRAVAQRLIRKELAGQRSPAKLSKLVVSLVPREVDWRPGRELLQLLDEVGNETPLSPEAQGVATRAFLVAGDEARARRCAELVVHLDEAIDPLDVQAVAEALCYDPSQAEGIARTAWLNVLSAPPRWLVRRRLQQGPDLVRDKVVTGLAEQLYLAGEYSRLTPLLSTELACLGRWSDLWGARRQALLLVDTLCEMGDRDRAFDALSQLLPVAIAAGDPRFVLEDVLGRCQSAQSVGPLEPGTWQVVLERLLPSLSSLASADLTRCVENEGLALLARARWAVDDPDFIPTDLAKAMAASGIRVPPELLATIEEGPGPSPIAERSDERVDSVLIVGGYTDVQQRAADALRRVGITVKFLSPGFDENVDERRVREALQGVQRVVVVWKCILHKVTIVLDQLLSKQEFKSVQKSFAAGKGHTSIVATALGLR